VTDLKRDVSKMSANGQDRGFFGRRRYFTENVPETILIVCMKDYYLAVGEAKRRENGSWKCSMRKHTDRGGGRFRRATGSG
jgi:hypothetical protein